MHSLGQDPTEEELKEMVAEVDVDGNGTIDFNEFLQMMAHKSSRGESVEDLREAFKVFDKDGSGSISREELKGVLHSLGETVNDEDIDNMMLEADEDGNGEISFEEFIKMMAKP
ncbi:hypothetical protein AX16_004084 [Volvariella volvacea WC 439]|nr:hypothetical protein AX16_004084 [Volvariella volvacea WC 439]